MIAGLKISVLWAWIRTSSNVHGDMARILFFVAFLGWLLIGWDFVLVLILDILIVWIISILDGSGKKKDEEK